MALQRITDAVGVSLILILSDINMPRMTGLELLPKAKTARPDVPVIMITAYGDAETKRKALEGGAEAEGRTYRAREPSGQTASSADAGRGRQRGGGRNCNLKIRKIKIRSFIRRA